MEDKTVYWTKSLVESQMDNLRIALNDIAVLTSQLESQQYNHASDQTAVLSPVQWALDAVNQKWQPRIDETASRIAAAKQSIDEMTKQLAEGVKAVDGSELATVRGLSLMVVYSAGRVTWDTRKLEGYAAAHPEIAPFRKQGDPFVTIKPIK